MKTARQIWEEVQNAYDKCNTKSIRKAETKVYISVNPEEEILDINHDGKVDAKDKSLAGKVLSSKRRGNSNTSR